MDRARRAGSQRTAGRAARRGQGQHPDHAGDLVTPLNRAQIPQRDALAAAAAVAVLAFVALIAALVVRRRLDRRRMAAWDADWLRTEPRWTSRR